MSNKWLHHLSITMSYLIYPFVCANHVKDILHIQRAFETQNKMYRQPPSPRLYIFLSLIITLVRGFFPLLKQTTKINKFRGFDSTKGNSSRRYGPAVAPLFSCCSEQFSLQCKPKQECEGRVRIIYTWTTRFLLSDLVFLQTAACINLHWCSK